MKRRHVIGIVTILAFVVFSAFTFHDSLTPYVNFTQAKSIAGNVQVRGISKLIKPIVASRWESRLTKNSDGGQSQGRQNE